MARVHFIPLSVVAVIAAAGCGPGAPVAHVTPPSAQAMSVELLEDSTATGQLSASDVDSPVLTYLLIQGPAHGDVQLDAATGVFTYTPARNYNGSDSLQFMASDGQANSAPATVTFAIAPVNDPPWLPPIPDQTNSAETRQTSITLPPRDVDGEVVQYTVTVADPTVADAIVDSTATLIITPKAHGTTTVSLTASDGVFQVAESFEFTVTDVTKSRQWSFDDPRAQAISITNTSDVDVTFDLRHNRALLATTGDQLVADVQAMLDEVPQEPFERKLWRYVRDETYHWDPLTGDYWQHDPLLFVDSVGFGYCDDATAVYASLARTAGMTARGWALSGHVVPEVYVGGRWSMYDPDLGVYYNTSSGAVAGVEELAADPTLITAPFNPPVSTAFSHSDFVASLYTSVADNQVLWPSFYVASRTRARLSLPASARITYPGLWSAPPISMYATAPPATAQLRLELPTEFTGRIDWPLVPWDVQGSGQVRIGGSDFAAGSPELTEYLQAFGEYASQDPSGTVEVVASSGPLAIVYLVNPMRFDLTSATTLELRSMNAWALDIATAPLSDENRLQGPAAEAVARFH